MKLKVLLAVTAALASVWSLRAQRYDGLIDKTVALVGNSMIQLSQVEGEVQMMQFQGYVSDRNLRCEVLENMMISKLFYTQAQLDSLSVNPDMVDASLNERVKLAVRERLLEFRQRILDGEQFSLLATLYSEDPGSAMRGGELGMASKSIFWPAFSDAAMSLKEGQVSPIVETPDGFHLIQLIKKDGDMFNARHILIKPKYTIEDRDSAFIRLDSIRNVVMADSISFQQAARIYSEDSKSRTNGGMVADPMTGAPFFEVDRLKPADYNILKNMKEGEISQPFESVDDEGRSGNTIYKIVRLEKIRPSHTATVDEDFNVLLDIATNQKRVKAIEDFIKDKQTTTYIVIDPMFQNCDFRREGWVK